MQGSLDSEVKVKPRETRENSDGAQKIVIEASVVGMTQLSPGP